MFFKSLMGEFLFLISSSCPGTCLLCKFSKHLQIYLEQKLNFDHHIKEKVAKAMK